tara:strand:- start:419 stop:772 length:354 start_codon:yes stop_codon:yes gene_type:complete
MELSLAINTSLMRLAKKCVFCTEPFRIPFAGKLHVCCFDKTGTLTSDDIILEGAATLSEKSAKESKAREENSFQLQDPSDVSLAVELVAGGCHMLTHVQGEIIGDPMERYTRTNSIR